MVRGAARWFCHIGMITWSIDHKFAEKTLVGTKENTPLHRWSEIQDSSASFSLSRLLSDYESRGWAVTLRVLSRATVLAKDAAQMDTLCTSLSIKTSYLMCFQWTLHTGQVNFLNEWKRGRVIGWVDKCGHFTPPSPWLAPSLTPSDALDIFMASHSVT